VAAEFGEQRRLPAALASNDDLVGGAQRLPSRVFTRLSSEIAA
jgi:hypothetical protein